MSDLIICKVECGIKDVNISPFIGAASFDMVLRVRAVAARSDIPAAEHRFRERAKALVESIKKSGAK